VDRLVQLVNKRTLRIVGADKALVVNALLGCRDSGRVSFADSLIQVEAQSHSLDAIVTFDQRFPRQGVPVRLLSGDG
jgi:predicted nucleic-acid-binding protein